MNWSQTPRPRRVRESLFVVLAGSPGAALLGLARLAASPGDHDAANLQARAAAMAAATAPRPTRHKGRR